MLFVKMSPTGLPLEVRYTYLNEFEQRDPAWQNRWDWKDYATVERLARYITAMTGKTHLPVDNTAAVSPRYDVMVAPAVGDEVSYGFNGDYYPDGTITKITKGWMITTSGGHTYRRKGNTSDWRQPGGTWGLVSGHHYEQNPHF
jgi:hypothetical protein